MHSSDVPCTHCAGLSEAGGPGRDAHAASASSDWSLMLDAVKLRLAAGAAAAAAPAAEPPRLGQPWPLACLVDECIKALDQVQAALREEDGWQQQLGRDVAVARRGGTHVAGTALHPHEFLRFELERQAANLSASNSEWALLSVDVDGGRQVQARHGDLAFEEVLKIVGMRLRRCVRADDMVSGLEQGRFAILLKGQPSRDQLSHIACKLFDAVSAPVKIGAMTLALLPSIGIALFPSDAKDPATLLDLAAEAMHCATDRHAGYAFHDECASGAMAGGCNCGCEAPRAIAASRTAAALLSCADCR